MQPSNVITEARTILQDEDAGGYRWSDAKLLVFVNDFTKSLAKLKPALFYDYVDIVLVAGTDQTVSRLTTYGVVDIRTNNSGNQVNQFDPQAMALGSLSWRNDSGPVTGWAPVGNDPWRFMVYPKGVAAEKVTGVVIAIPQDIALGTAMPVGDAYRASAANYVAGRALSTNTNTADVARGNALLSLSATLLP